MRRGPEASSCPSHDCPPTPNPQRPAESAGGRQGDGRSGAATSGQVGGRTFPPLPLPHPPALWTGCHPEHCRKMWLQQKPLQNPGRGAGPTGVTHRAGGAAAAAAAEPRTPSAAAASWFAHNPPGPGAAAASGAAAGGRRTGDGGGEAPAASRAGVAGWGWRGGGPLSALWPRPSRRGGRAGLRAERRAREPRARPPATPPSRSPPPEDKRGAAPGPLSQHLCGSLSRCTAHPAPSQSPSSVTLCLMICEDPQICRGREAGCRGSSLTPMSRLGTGARAWLLGLFTPRVLHSGEGCPSPDRTGATAFLLKLWEGVVVRGDKAGGQKGTEANIYFAPSPGSVVHPHQGRSLQSSHTRGSDPSHSTKMSWPPEIVVTSATRRGWPPLLGS
jgi:hypothetical protein